jgi:hypothetical protein
MNIRTTTFIQRHTISPRYRPAAEKKTNSKSQTGNNEPHGRQTPHITIGNQAYNTGPRSARPAAIKVCCAASRQCCRHCSAPSPSFPPRDAHGPPEAISYVCPHQPSAFGKMAPPTATGLSGGNGLVGPGTRRLGGNDRRPPGSLGRG